MKQTEFFKKESKAYGGKLLSARKGRSHGRPLDTRNTMHLVLRSTVAKGDWSFKLPRNEKKIRSIIKKFSTKYGIGILSLANVGNHLHFQIKLSNRFSYVPFIRAVTGSIAMAVMGVSRWKPSEVHFWDYRPFTRVVTGFKAFLKLRDYVLINQLEGFGHTKLEARVIFEGLEAVRLRDSS